MTSTDRTKPQRFVLLDGLRGIAAVFIIQRHTEELLGDALPSSYLGVDLFFGLSGFVLAHAYGQILRTGTMTPAAFMKARLLRLYPLYGLALALVIAYYAYSLVVGRPVFFGQYVIGHELAIGIVAGLLFLPSPVTISFNAALFLVHPAWSLFNELVANLAYAWKGARASLRQILLVIAVSLIGLVIAAVQFDRLHAGFRWQEMYAGMARVFFSFFVGVLIYRYRRTSMTLQPLGALACLLVVALVLASPTPKAWKAPFDLMVVVIVWPALLYAASSIVPGPRTAAVAGFLGTASYAVYVLHLPMLDWALVLWPSMTDPTIAPYAGVAFIAVTTVISWLLTVGLDQPLQRRFRRRRTRQATAF
jgi:peptidoglycan/LPS O-acetylase OafA/YrhL